MAPEQPSGEDDYSIEARRGGVLDIMYARDPGIPILMVMSGRSTSGLNENVGVRSTEQSAT